MWLIALLGAFFVILMILLGFCIAYCCLRNDKNKNLSYEYSSPRNHAFDVSEKSLFDFWSLIKIDQDNSAMYYNTPGWWRTPGLLTSIRLLWKWNISRLSDTRLHVGIISTIFTRNSIDSSKWTAYEAAEVSFPIIFL